jgi:DNA polymerase-3 subunit chi
MTVDFYVLEDAPEQQALHQLCLLLEVPYADKQHIFIHTASNDEAVQLDNLLWTYRDDSFMAHDIASENNAVKAPVEISTLQPSSEHRGVLVNLTRSVPHFYQQFNRVIEIVFAEPSVQQAARERFRQYREQGCDLHTHKMKVNEA